MSDTIPKAGDSLSLCGSHETVMTITGVKDTRVFYTDGNEIPVTKVTKTGRTGLYSIPLRKCEPAFLIPTTLRGSKAPSLSELINKWRKQAVRSWRANVFQSDIKFEQFLDW